MSAPSLPLNVAAELGTATAPRLEQRWGAARRLDDGHDAWRKLAWTQSWFGFAGLEVAYTFHPGGHLTRIDISLADAEAAARAMQSELGAADEAGPSPGVAMSLRYWSWQRDGVLFTLEDYAPGAELGIVRAR